MKAMFCRGLTDKRYYKQSERSVLCKVAWGADGWRRVRPRTNMQWRICSLVKESEEGPLRPRHKSTAQRDTPAAAATSAHSLPPVTYAPVIDVVYIIGRRRRNGSIHFRGEVYNFGDQHKRWAMQCQCTCSSYKIWGWVHYISKLGGRVV